MDIINPNIISYVLITNIYNTGCSGAFLKKNRGQREGMTQNTTFQMINCDVWRQLR